MSTFNVTFEIGNMEGTRWEPVEALVDTGSTLSAAPRDLLLDLGIRPVRRQVLELANGELVEYDVGDAPVRLEGQQAITPVIFGESGEHMALGAVTLETFFLAVDPVHQRLVPVHGFRITRARPQG